MSMLPLFLTLSFGSSLVGSHLLRDLELMPASAIVCTTEEQCRQQFSNMSTAIGGVFLVGDFPTKGCFSKNGNVYFGSGSMVEEELAETDLPGSQERIWCNNGIEVTQPTVPTMQPSSETVPQTISPVDDGDGSFFFDVTSNPTVGQQSTRIPVADSDTDDVISNGVVCLTEDQCKGKFSSMNTGGDFLVGDFPTKGCFSKNGNVYFGTGGVVEDELAETELPGSQERLWCEREAEKPTTNPSMARTTYNPTNQPTLTPGVVTASPVKQIITLSPATASPTKQLTFIPVTLSPTSPSSLQLNITKPSQLPIIDINSSSPTSTPSSQLVEQIVSPSQLPIIDINSTSPTSTPSSQLVEQTESLSQLPIIDINSSSPTSTPSSQLVEQTVQPSQLPIIDINSTSPTSTPSSQLAEQTESPSQLPNIDINSSSTPSTSSSRLVEQTVQPSQLPIIDISSTRPTFNPILTPSASPTEVSPVTIHPSASLEQNTNDLSSLQKPTSSPTEEKTSAVTLSPLELSIQTHPGTYTVDTQELKDLVSIHLMETMEAVLISFEATKVDINITQFSGQPSRHLQPSGLIFASDSNTTNVFKFTLNGVVYFTGSSVPTSKALDMVTLESFAGKKGDEFVHSLQNAEDSGLRTTRSVNVEALSETSQNDEITLVENQLNQTDDDTVSNRRMSLLAIVFGVGLVLVAMHVMKTRRGRKSEQEKQDVMYDDIGDEESPSESEFPTYIEVLKPDEKVNEPWFDASCYMPWFFGSQPETTDVATEIKPAQFVSGELPISSNAATDFDVISKDNSEGLSKTLSVFPKDLQTISGESDTEKNQQPFHGWEICGGGDVEHTSASNNDTSSSSLEGQNRVSGNVWGQKPTDGAVS